MAWRWFTGETQATTAAPRCAARAPWRWSTSWEGSPWRLGARLGDEEVFIGKGTKAFGEMTWRFFREIMEVLEEFWDFWKGLESQKRDSSRFKKKRHRLLGFAWHIFSAFLPNGLHIFRGGPASGNTWEELGLRSDYLEERDELQNAEVLALMRQEKWMLDAWELLKRSSLKEKIAPVCWGGLMFLPV